VPNHFDPDPGNLRVIKVTALAFVVSMLTVLWAVGGMFSAIIGVLLGGAVTIFHAVAEAEEQVPTSVETPEPEPQPYPRKRGTW
jgi:hypothetical protein